MLQNVLQVHSRPEGEAIEGVRRNEVLTSVAFLGRRRRVYRQIVKLSGAKPGDRVLDVGCSGGYLARLLGSAAGTAGSVTGVDPSAAAIAYAQRRAPANCTFAVGVAQDLSFPEGSFGVVTSTLAVHHVPGADRPAAFTELYRVTRPGGRLLVADFGTSKPHPLAPRGMRHNDAGLLEGLAEAAGFRIETRGDLPVLRYVAAVRPAGSRPLRHPAARTDVLGNARVITCSPPRRRWNSGIAATPGCAGNRVSPGLAAEPMAVPNVRRSSSDWRTSAGGWPCPAAQ